MSNWRDKNLEVYEDEASLEISFKWYSPKAFFLLFFSIIWCGFLAFWYGISFSTGAPLIALLFPILHVAVGIGLLHYVLCLFFNKTYFHIYEGELYVVHQPIPWWRGNRRFKVKDIQQLYVKEKRTSSKNGNDTFSYDLRVKLKNNQDKSLMNINDVGSHTAQELEERLEKFLGIQDKPVKGELKGQHKKGTAGKFQSARQHNKQAFNSSFADLFFVQSGDNLHFEGNSLKVSAIAQYDWHNGNTDKLLQLLNDEQQETILYIRQQKALLKTYEEKDLIQGKMPIKFDQRAPAPHIDLEGRSYFLEQSYMGESFFSFASGHTSTNQWVYLTDDGQHYLRIQEQKGQLSYSLGRQLSTDDFSKPLNLDDLPEHPKPEPKPQPRDWDNKDFV